VKQHKKHKLFIILFLLVFITIFFCICHVFQSKPDGAMEIFYGFLNNDVCSFSITDFFYIPVILAAFWYKINVFWVVLYLSGLFFSIHLFKGQYYLLVDDFVRFFYLLACGFGVAYLSDNLHKIIRYKRYKNIISSLQQPVIIVDKGNEITMKNVMFSSVFGHDCNELEALKKNLDEKTQSYFESLVKKTFAGEAGNIFVYLSDRAGDTKFFEINFYPLYENRRIEYIVLNFRDQTEKKTAETELQLSVEKQKVIIDILELLNNNQSEPNIIEIILNLIRKDTGIGLLGLRLTEDVACYVSDSEVFDEGFISNLTANCWLFSHDSREVDLCSGGICEKILKDYVEERDGESLSFMCNDLSGLSHGGEDHICKIQGHSIQSILLVPLKIEKRHIGFIFSVDQNVNAYSPDTLELLETIAPSISIALTRMKNEKELKQSIEEKELLLKEVHHRVKNNMQIISSLISLQATRYDDFAVRDALVDCQNRVKTMALVHEKIYKSSNFEYIDIASYIEGLVRLLMSSYKISTDLIKIKMDVSRNNVNINTAIPLAQMINELVTNCFKHAFPNGAGGQLDIIMFKDENSRFVLKISDTGPGLGKEVSFPEGGSLGFQLISALTKQLRGEVTITSEAGATFLISFPAEC